eukprot:1613608-Heterocapsa_arctica.AAC.1
MATGTLPRDLMSAKTHERSCSLRAFWGWPWPEYKYTLYTCMTVRAKETVVCWMRLKAISLSSSPGKDLTSQMLRAS